jgi:hypothetical protein
VSDLDCDAALQSAHVNVGAVLTRQFAISVEALNGSGLLVPILVTLAMLEAKLPLPSAGAARAMRLCCARTGSAGTSKGRDLGKALG